MAESNNVTSEELELEGNAEVRTAPLNLKQVRENAERLAIMQAMANSDGNISQAADVLGVSRPTLYDLMNKYGLK